MCIMALYLFDFDNLAVVGRRFILVDAYAVFDGIGPLASIRVVNLKVRNNCLHCILRMWASVLHRDDKCLFGRVTLIDRYNHGKIRIAIGFWNHVK